jgi:hypothetical protein
MGLHPDKTLHWPMDTARSRLERGLFNPRI